MRCEPSAISYLLMQFWIPAFAGMTMLTAFDDYDTVSGGGHEAVRFGYLLPFMVSSSLTVRARPVEASFSL
jgi:hypothetical protein